MKLLHNYLKIISLFPLIIIYKLSNKKNDIKIDALRYCEILNIKFKGSFDIIYLLYYFKEFRDLFYYRLGDKFNFLRFFASGFNNLYIFTTTQIEPGGIFFWHPFSTVVNAKSIGYGCIIRQCTTIGNINEDNLKVPIIKRNVNIGSNVCIIGNITIEENVIIGAGSVVTKNVPSNCTIVGNPARIIKKDGVKCSIRL